jgi:glutamate-1-semialdehyde 2,1-aminomutase
MGHSPDKIIEAVNNYIQEKGVLLAHPSELSGDVAERIVTLVPSIEKVRIGTTGSESVAAAVRLARAATGKDKIIKFEGAYHGWLDTLYCNVFSTPLEVSGTELFPNTIPSSAGIPAGVMADIIVQPYNNDDVLRKTVERHHHRIAAIILEPVANTAGGLRPRPGWLEFIREITRTNDIILIFDEVQTGMRFRGSAQGYFGVTPDLTVLAKTLAAGFPISAFGGRRDLMDHLRGGTTTHQGTYNANSISLAASRSYLDELMNHPDRFDQLFKLGDMVFGGMVEIIKEAGFGCLRMGLGPWASIFFTDKEEIDNYRDARRYGNYDYYMKFQREMMKNGILLPAGMQKMLFISTAHTEEDAERTLLAAKKSIGAVRGG